jgi:hypothetical protein
MSFLRVLYSLKRAIAAALYDTQSIAPPHDAEIRGNPEKVPAAGTNALRRTIAAPPATGGGRELR